MDKAKNVTKNVTIFGAGAGTGAVIKGSSEKAKQKIEEEVSGGKKGGSGSSSSGAYSKAAKNDPNLADYVKKRKSLRG